MRRAKHWMMAAVVAVGALMGGATPQPLFAEATAVEAAVQLPDGDYTIHNERGDIVGIMVVRGGEIVAVGWFNEPIPTEMSTGVNAQ